MERDPEPGVTITGVRLTSELAGAMGCAMFTGVSADDRPMIVTVGPRQQRPLDEVKRALGYTLSGVTACTAVVEDQSPSDTWHVLIEEAPAGVPLTEVAPLAEDDAIALLQAIARIAAQAHARGIVLHGIDPRLCFVNDDASWSGMAPRSIQFLLGMPPMRGGLCLEQVYLPPTVWGHGAGTPASDVFAICALGLFLVTGRHPFAGATFNDAMAAAGRAEPELPETELGALLGRGLAADELRPSAAELLAELRSLSGTNEDLGEEAAASEGRDLCILAETRDTADEVGDRIVEPLLRTPWGAMGDMMLYARLEPEWEPLDETKIAAEYHRRGGHLMFSARDDRTIGAQLMNITGVVAGTYVAETAFGPAGCDRAREALRRMLAKMPKDAVGKIFVDALAERHLALPWFQRHGIATLPEPLEGLPWLVALPLSNYRRILSIPGLGVKKHKGRAWLQLYDDPFDYDSDAAVQRVAAISARLEHVGTLWEPGYRRWWRR